jgi:hypothetical protein
MKKYFLFICFLTFMITGCVETPVPIPELEIKNSDKVVLVEYLTGVKCPNCPRGSSILKSAKDKFPENIAIVGIHGRFLTDPLSKSKFDFRNDFSRQLEESYRPFLGKPAALINRVKFADEPNLAADLPDLWPAYIADEVTKPVSVNIISSHQINPDTRKLDINLGISASESINESTKISVYITESGIIDAQESVGQIIENYQHEHVLRHMLTAWNGDSFASKLSQGELINKNYTYTIPADYLISNLEVIISVSLASNRQVLQAHKIEL